MRITKNVFLDTEAIVAQQLDFTSPALAALEHLALRGEAKLLTTSIVEQEVHSNIAESLSKAEIALTRLKGNHSILRNSKSPAVLDLLKPIEIAELQEELFAQYREYLHKTKTEVVSLQTASVERVFRDYFARSAPFGEDKKKAEFPDAFNLQALEAWCEKRAEKVYVVSADPDVVSYCEKSKSLVGLKRPSEYVDLVNLEDLSARKLEESTEKKIEDVTNAIAQQFENAGFYLNDLDGEVDGVKVTNVHVDELSLLQFGRNISQFAVVGTIEFEANISYEDPNTGIWDGEDKVMIGMETVQCEVDRSVDLDATIEVETSDDGLFKTVRSVAFPKRDFSFNAIEDDYPYK